MKKIISIVLVTVFLICSVIPCAAAQDNGKLQFNSDGTFKILNISDIQDDHKLSKLTVDLIKSAIETEKPDFIVLTGDNIAGYRTLSAKKTEQGIREFMDIFESCKIPVAIVFGNHDELDSGMTKEEQMALYNEYSVSMSIDEGEALWGCGTYNIPIYSSTDAEKVAFNCWFFDSGEKDENGDYDCVKQDQIEWYKSTSDALKAANGGEAVPSIAFQHIIVPEIYDALEETSFADKSGLPFGGKYYKLPQTAKEGSVIGESPCPSGKNSGEFEAMVSQGDVIGIVTGHDHCNAFIVPYKGIDLINSPTCGFMSYGSNESRGLRVITLNENDLQNYDSYIVAYDDYHESNSAGMFEYGFYGFVGELFTFFYKLWARIENLFM